MLTYLQRKKRLRDGAQTRIAERRGKSAATISRVQKGDLWDEEIQADLCAEMHPPTTRMEAFGPRPAVLPNPRRRQVRSA